MPLGKNANTNIPPLPTLALVYREDGTYKYHNRYGPWRNLKAGKPELEEFIREWDLNQEATERVRITPGHIAKHLRNRFVPRYGDASKEVIDICNKFERESREGKLEKYVKPLEEAETPDEKRKWEFRQWEADFCGKEELTKLREAQVEWYKSKGRELLGVEWYITLFLSVHFAVNFLPEVIGGFQA